MIRISKIKRNVFAIICFLLFLCVACQKKADEKENAYVAAPNGNSTVLDIMASKKPEPNDVVPLLTYTAMSQYDVGTDIVIEIGAGMPEFITGIDYTNVPGVLSIQILDENGTAAVYGPVAEKSKAENSASKDYPKKSESNLLIKGESYAMYYYFRAIPVAEANSLCPTIATVVFTTDMLRDGEKGSIEIKYEVTSDIYFGNAVWRIGYEVKDGRVALDGYECGESAHMHLNVAKHDIKMYTWDWKKQGSK